MNECFIIGKIKSKIEYKFIINSKDVAIAIFEIELKNRAKILIKAYNEIADYCLQELEKENIIFINGILEEDNIRAEYIEKIK